MMLARWWRQRQRKRILRTPMPASWASIVQQRMPFVGSYDDDERARFLSHLQVFAHEKHFEGIGGVVVTDEMRVVIAGLAARLSHNLDLDAFEELVSVVVAPGDLHTTDGVRARGLAHRYGTVVVNWDAVKHGVVIPTDGHDVTIHELAHILDLGDGDFDGTPVLASRGALRTWARVLSKHFLQLRADPEGSILRAYGATNEAEFFAVATEVFFEKPRQLQRKKPDLYAALAAYYRSDPAAQERR